MMERDEWIEKVVGREACGGGGEREEEEKKTQGLVRRTIRRENNMFGLSIKNPCQQ